MPSRSTKTSPENRRMTTPRGESSTANASYFALPGFSTQRGSSYHDAVVRRSADIRYYSSATIRRKRQRSPDASDSRRTENICSSRFQPSTRDALRFLRDGLQLAIASTTTAIWRSTTRRARWIVRIDSAVRRAAGVCPIYIMVDDVAAACGAVAANGGESCRRSAQTPRDHREVPDPAGNISELVSGDRGGHPN